MLSTVSMGRVQTRVKHVLIHKEPEVAKKRICKTGSSSLTICKCPNVKDALKKKTSSFNHADHSFTI